jgi:hypothetical protein
MMLKDYLKHNKISKVKFAKKIGINRMTLAKYLDYPDLAPIIFRLAIEFISAGEVNRNDWEDCSL